MKIVFPFARKAAKRPRDPEPEPPTIAYAVAVFDGNDCKLVDCPLERLSVTESEGTTTWSFRSTGEDKVQARGRPHYGLLKVNGFPRLVIQRKDLGFSVAELTPGDLVKFNHFMVQPLL